ncbi:hypothetical protein WMY93_003160 [Mugilogobius chulae]|uniref:Nuclear body protein SP140-like protein n=1 Tax=Mugilogobius chulae TaxID=88201 RepID=A0AAW0PYK2_9GOBI
MKKAGPKNTKKRRKTIDDDDDEQPSTSTQNNFKLNVYLNTASPLKKGERGEIWTWSIYKVQLPVTCGELKGFLNRNRLARGDKCIVVKRRWYTPCQFEQLAGKASSKNWKLSIRCMGTPLKQLLQEGHLKCVGYKRTPKAKKLLFPSEESTTVSVEIEDSDSESSHTECSSDSTEEHEENDEGLAQSQTETRNSIKKLKVICGNSSGLLHTKRFASGKCGRSIRTDTSWLTPVEFVKEVSCQTDYSWRKDIKCEGKPLGELIEAMCVHLQDNERNDDECWICLRESTEGETLVACDECPRSFHQKCHLPHISDTMLGDGEQWRCTLCEFSKTLTQSWRWKQQCPHCQYLLLRLYREDEDCIFKSDPCHLPKYESVISTPMWFDEVSDKLQTDRYHTVGDFVSDVQLIFANCASYNRDNPEVFSKGTNIKKFFQEEMNTVFKTQQKILKSEF